MGASHKSTKSSKGVKSLKNRAIKGRDAAQVKGGLLLPAIQAAREPARRMK